jgi:hypothetical protein
MSKPKTLAALFTLLTAGLVTACDPAAAVLDGFRRPSTICTDLGDASCPKPIVHPDDIAPN